MSVSGALDVADYAVIAAFLALSLAIGIYYGFCKSQRTTEEYLYANRQMHLLPVSVSLFVTFASAISCLGMPADVYTYSYMILYVTIGITLAMAVSAITVVPLLYPLRLNSAYEYLGRRFNSRAVQLLGTFIGMLKTLLYMSVVLFSPALALEQAVGFPLWLSIFVIGSTGTIYTSLGGFRSVIWTDVFQCILLYSGLMAILILGGMKVGSIEKIFRIAEEGGRLRFHSDIDPRVRHSIWSCVIGGFFTWFVNCCNQSAVQRMCSMRSQRDAKIAFLINLPFEIVFDGLMVLTGLVMYAYFASKDCDPVDAGYVSTANQLMPHFVIIILGDYPALAGLFLAALFSGSLSSLSSGINALATNTVNDLLGGYLGKMSQARQTLLAKLFVFGYGAIAVGVAYAMKSNTGPVTQISSTAFGACGGPYVGMFMLGAIFPRANWIGALVGGILGIVFNIWLAISAMILGNPAPKSPPIPISGCTEIHNSTTRIYVTPNGPSVFELTTDGFLSSGIENGDDSGTFPLYDISYLYLGLTGFFVSLVTGLIVSYVVNCCSEEAYSKPCDPKYIFPFLRNVWGLGKVLDKISDDEWYKLKASAEQSNDIEAEVKHGSIVGVHFGRKDMAEPIGSE